WLSRPPVRRPTSSCGEPMRRSTPPSAQARTATSSIRPPKSRASPSDANEILLRVRRFGLGLQLALLVSCGVASGYAWRAALVPKRTAVRVAPATLPYEPAPLTRLAPRPQSAPTHVEAAQQPAHAKPHSPPHAQAAKTEHRPPTAETALASVT